MINMWLLISSTLLHNYLMCCHFIQPFFLCHLSVFLLCLSVNCFPHLLLDFFGSPGHVAGIHAGSDAGHAHLASDLRLWGIAPPGSGQHADRQIEEIMKKR